FHTDGEDRQQTQVLHGSPCDLGAIGSQAAGPPGQGRRERSGFRGFRFDRGSGEQRSTPEITGILWRKHPREAESCRAADATSGFAVRSGLWATALAKGLARPAKPG